MLTSAQDPALNGATSPAPDATPVMAPQAVVQPSASLPVVIDMSNPTVRGLVEQARAEEKQKLYAEQQALRDQITNLRTTLEGKLTPDEKQTQHLQELQQQLQVATTQLSQLQAQITASAQQHAAETTQLRLQSYLDRRLREETAKGTKMLTELIGGVTENEIEQSIQLAISEYERLRAQFAQEMGILPNQQIPAPAIAPVSAIAPLPVATTTMVTPPGPSAFPTAPNAQSVPEVSPGTAGFSQAVADLTTPEAIRSGAYARNRVALLQGVRQGVVPPGGQPFANMPRTVVPTMQHGVVVQPQGHPTLPAVNPRVAVTPPQPLPIPQSSAMPAPGAPPSTVPQPEDFRAAAIAAAERGLRNPRSQVATVVGQRPPEHPEYKAQPAANFSFEEGVHPMATRNSL